MKKIIGLVAGYFFVLISWVLGADRWLSEKIGLRNVFLYGLAALGAGSIGLASYVWLQFSKLDGGAPATYWHMAKKIMETGDSAAATVWRAKVSEGLTFAEVDESIKNIANENNIKNVGELPLYKQVEASTGKPYRKVKIYMYCNAVTAAKMLDYSDAFSAYLPCRVTLLEDKTGKLWLYTLNMDMMIHGGKTLPVALKKEAEDVKRIIKDVLTRGASGDF